MDSLFGVIALAGVAHIVWLLIGYGSVLLIFLFASIGSLARSRLAWGVAVLLALFLIWWCLQPFATDYMGCGLWVDTWHAFRIWSVAGASVVAAAAWAYRIRYRPPSQSRHQPVPFRLLVARLLVIGLGLLLMFLLAATADLKSG
jgi:hypothetical protein